MIHSDLWDEDSEVLQVGSDSADSRISSRSSAGEVQGAVRKTSSLISGTYSAEVRDDGRDLELHIERNKLQKQNRRSRRSMS